MPDLYLAKAMSNDECDALPSQARKPPSDRDDCGQESWRHSRLVAEGGAGASWFRANGDRPFGRQRAVSSRVPGRWICPALQKSAQLSSRASPRAR